MFAIHHIQGTTYYIPCHTNIGIVLDTHHKVHLIDSGHSIAMGKKIWQLLQQQQWELEDIFLTHHHFDHCNGATYLQEISQCPVYLPSKEISFVEKKELQLTPLSERILPSGWKLLSLPGHSPAMVGYVTPDQVAFLGDTLVKPSVLDRYHLLYTYHLKTHITTLQRLFTLHADYYVPSHLSLSNDIRELIEYNLAHIEKTTATISELLLHSHSVDTILNEFIKNHSLPIPPHELPLYRLAIQSYITLITTKNSLFSI